MPVRPAPDGRYMQMWAAASSSGDLSGVQLDRCSTQPSASGTRMPPFCDADADATTLSSYTAESADAVLVFARAMQAVIQDGGSLDWRSPAALYNAMLALDAKAGVSGNIVLGAEGDRAGSFELLNLQLMSGTETSQRRRELFVTLDTLRADLVSLGIWDRANGYQAGSNLPLFHGRTTKIPYDSSPTFYPPTCGEDGVREDDFFGVNVSGCTDGGGHTLRFDWQMTPPGTGCELPRDQQLECEYVPLENPLATVLSAVGFLLPLTALGLVCIGHALGHRRPARDTDRNRQQMVLDSAIRGWVILGRACAVVGALAICAVPLILTGQNTASRCVARPMLRSLAPALIAFGVAVCDPRLKDESPRNQTKRVVVRRCRCPPATVLLEWCAALLQLVALALLVSLAAVLADWSQGDDAPLPESYERQVLVAVRDERLVVPVNTTRCPRQALASRSGIRGVGFYAATLMPLLLGVCLCAHVLRLCAARHLQRYSHLGELLATLFTLFACILYVSILWFYDRIDKYSTLAMTSFAVGWWTLATEVLLPAYLGYVARLKQGRWLLLQEDRKEVTLKPPKNQKHLFLSRAPPGSNLRLASPTASALHTPRTRVADVWASGQDQVHNMHTALQLMCPSLQMWLDVEQIKDTENLEKAVRESDALLIFLSKGYLASPFCRQELGAAWKENKPLVLVRESRNTDQGGVSSFDDLISPSELERVALGDFYNDDIKDAMEAHLPQIIKHLTCI